MSYQPYYGQPGRVIAESTGGMVLDGTVPYEGVSKRVGSIATGFEITDSPQIPLPLQRLLPCDHRPSVPDVLPF
ncbi:MAG TPA: hypothetical protein VK638_43175 [Edaphobacter sp.]|nr:hypothetical protein [Edaphobacter sp.]